MESVRCAVRKEAFDSDLFPDNLHDDEERPLDANVLSSSCERFDAEDGDVNRDIRRAEACQGGHMAIFQHDLKSWRMLSLERRTKLNEVFATDRRQVVTGLAMQNINNSLQPYTKQISLFRIQTKMKYI